MPKPAYPFVDNIRCIALLAIVAEHTSNLGLYTYSQDASPYWAYLCSIQAVKFGTIAFFIIAGFLFAENSKNHNVFRYVKRRMDSIFKPWLIWSLIFLFLLTVGATVKSLVAGAPFSLILSDWWLGAKTVYLHSHYWLIMNFFFCLAVLLICKDILHSWLFGGVLFLLTTFYSINVHTEWIMPQHTTAIFGFVFFYWLGAQFNHRFEAIEKKLKTTSGWWFMLAVAATLFLAVHEASFLSELKSVDPLNTLRISNVIFSVAVFAALLKVKSLRWLSFLQPGKTTYGIFLIHYIVLFSFLPYFMGELNSNITLEFTAMEMFRYQLLRFLTVYILTFVIVKAFAKSEYSWMIGIKPYTKPATQQATHQERRIVLETEAA